MLLLLVAAFTTAAASQKTTIGHPLLSEPPAITFGNIIQAESPLRSASDSEDIDIRVRLDYNPDNYLCIDILCINENGSRVIDEVDLQSDGYMHLKETPGKYDFVAILTHADHDGLTVVIKENVDVLDSTPVILDSYSATNHIQFNAIASSGNKMTGDILQNGEVIEEGEVYAGHGFTEIFHNRHGLILSSPFFLQSILDGEKMTYGPQEGNIYINDLSDDTEFSAAHIRMGRTQAGMEFIVMAADGLKSQTVTNDISDFRYLNIKQHPHKYGNSHIQYNPAIKSTETFGYASAWNGDFSSLHHFNVKYQANFPNLDRVYLCIPENLRSGHPFEVYPIFGTNDDSGDNDLWERGSGVLMPLFKITEDDKIQLMDNPAANGFWKDDWTRTQEDPRTHTSAASDYLSCSIANGETIELGNSVPICIASIGYIRNSDSQLRFSFIGRNGELRNIDKYNTAFKMTADGEVISQRPYWNQSDFMNWRLRGGEFNSTKAEYKITIENTNVIVDGLDGYNKTTIYYDTNMSSPNPPALRSLQFRNTEGKITDRFKDLDEGVLEFYAGDFEYAETDQSYRWFFNYCNLENVKVEYAPYGSGQWRILDVEEVPDMFAPVAYGAFYRGSLGSVTAESPNGWYDLRIKLSDASDNYQIQELSPAFKLADITGIKTVKTDAVSLQGLEVEIFNLAGTLVWSGVFESAAATDLGHGVYVARAKGNDKSPVCKLSI